jgi:hypothetical protein
MPLMSTNVLVSRSTSREPGGSEAIMAPAGVTFARRAR